MSKVTLVYILIGLFSTVLPGCGNKKNHPVNGNDLLRRQALFYTRENVYLNTENPFSAEKAQLGRHLFYDNRLSVNNTKACASCHDPKFSFTDGYRRSIGAYGDLTRHNSPPLINIIFNQYLTATDSSLHFPEQQVHNPMFRTNPVELGWTNNEAVILQRISSDETYRQLFQKAFPSEKNLFTTKNIQQAITSFVKTIFSLQSNNDKGQLSEKEKKGRELFRSVQLKCAQCHSGVNFNQPVFQSTPYFNTGFFTDTAVHKGLYAFTGNKKDIGAYKVPTLRNLAFTAPYLHDGSAETLEDVIRLYEQGGYPAVQNKHPLVSGFKLNSQQRSELVAFLLGLSDSSVINNPAYRNPWKIK